MKQNYFVVNGNKYYTGSIFVVKNMGKLTEASFLYYDTDRQRYIYKINDCRCDVDYNHFWKTFVSVTDKVNDTVRMPVIKARKEIEIDGMFIGWLWYIFLMLISSICNGAVVLWALISAVFFKWRAKKIQEEGTYVEW